MKDSILKGTGNSRFLKSAIPEGTTWAEALAMLRAGTFPMDLNGINNAGFQQVGTPLNKANLLKDVNALTLGLTGDAVPSDMFNVLAHAGDLHVWRKTVVTKEPIPEVPGSYTLGSAAITNLARMTSNGYNGYAANILVSKEIKVNLDGSVELVSPTSRQMIVAGSSDRYTIDVNSDDLLGAENRYFTPREDSESNSSRCTLLIPPGTVYYVAPGTTYTTAMREIGFTSAFNAAQLVTGVPGTPAIPAGTTTTYPVSTNPNAYQDGNDAKPAGYTLGEVVTGLFRINRVYYSTTIQYADSVNVSDNGAVTLAGQSYYGLSAGEDSYNDAKKLAGKFIIADYDHNYCKIPKGVVLFIPANTTISFRQDVPGDEGYGIFFDRYQPVTGYAAIPANTTIEYLGCLGDKTRMQVVSYVGTGTYGSSNPNSLTFDFSPKLIMVRDNEAGTRFLEAIYGMELAVVNYSSGGYVSMIWNKKTVSWYSTADHYYQMNLNGTKYYAVAIG